MNRWLPWIVALIALAWLSPALRSPRPGDDGFDTSAFGHLPVQVGGRIKPFDTLARNSLLIISGKQVLRQEGRKTGATRWLLDVMFDPGTADAHAGAPGHATPHEHLHAALAAGHRPR